MYLLLGERGKVLEGGGWVGFGVRDVVGLEGGSASLGF
jgi:hypothetical protein